MTKPNPEELFNLGVKSSEAKDYIQAKKYFEKACGLKDGDGCLRLGEMQRSGEGVVKNRKQAMKNFKKGCELKNELACVGYIATEAEIMKERCELGDEVACDTLEQLLDLK
ncbi:SEL1-like repeat protein [Helicobacter pylori]|uniref:tetratricopeptide repeat protein n=1 Tax=Helicobacter pylori TaxID=210 RepID=UPI000C30CA55|nr:SEL1-like repeat protein [Helicobacter pylori]WRE50583.1 SEL1-like repeat protein [Helicobacter pylori]